MRIDRHVRVSHRFFHARKHGKSIDYVRENPRCVGVTFRSSFSSSQSISARWTRIELNTTHDRGTIDETSSPFFPPFFFLLTKTPCVCFFFVSALVWCNDANHQGGDATHTGSKIRIVLLVRGGRENETAWKASRRLASFSIMFFSPFEQTGEKRRMVLFIYFYFFFQISPYIFCNFFSQLVFLRQMTEISVLSETKNICITLFNDASNLTWKNFLAMLDQQKNIYVDINRGTRDSRFLFIFQIFFFFIKPQNRFFCPRHDGFVESRTVLCAISGLTIVSFERALWCLNEKSHPRTRGFPYYFSRAHSRICWWNLSVGTTNESVMRNRYGDLVFCYILQSLGDQWREEKMYKKIETIKPASFVTQYLRVAAFEWHEAKIKVRVRGEPSPLKMKAWKSKSGSISGTIDENLPWHTFT